MPSPMPGEYTEPALVPPVTVEAVSMENVTGLSAALTDAKNRANHTGAQAVATVTGLQAALDGKAASAHTHAIANVTGLQGALDGKAASAHTHPISEVVDLDDALAAKVPSPLHRSAAQGPPSAAIAAIGWIQIGTAVNGATIKINGRTYTCLSVDNGSASAIFTDQASLVTVINGLRAGVGQDASVSAEIADHPYYGFPMVKLTARTAGEDGNDITLERSSGTTGIFFLGNTSDFGTSTPISMNGGVDATPADAPGQVCYTGDAPPYRIDIATHDGGWQHVPNAESVVGI